MEIHGILHLILAFYCVHSQYVRTPYQLPQQQCCQQLLYPASCCPLSCCSPQYSVIPCCNTPGPEPGSKVRASFSIIGGDWVPALDNSNSTEYQQLEKSVVDQLYKTLDSDPYFRNARVSRFEQGSIVVIFVLEIADAKSPDEDTVNKTLEILKSAVQNGTLGPLSVSRDSFTVMEVLRGVEVMPKVEPEKTDSGNSTGQGNGGENPDQVPGTNQTSPEDEQQFRDEALQAHNNYRSSHGVGQLTLGPGLSADAQTWAKQLASMKMLEHASEESRKGAGENLAMRCGVGGSDLSGRRAVEMWYKELNDPGYDFSTPTPNAGTKHFTQIVWKGTQKLGIALANYKKDGMDCKVVVARYYPAGNIAGQYQANVFRALSGDDKIGQRKPQLILDQKHNKGHYQHVNLQQRHSTRLHHSVHQGNDHVHPHQHPMGQGHVQQKQHSSGHEQGHIQQQQHPMGQGQGHVQQQQYPNGQGQGQIQQQGHIPNQQRHPTGHVYGQQHQQGQHPQPHNDRLRLKVSRPILLHKSRNPLFTHPHPMTGPSAYLRNVFNDKQNTLRGLRPMSMKFAFNRPRNHIRRGSKKHVIRTPTWD